jgi:hypothetical protein
MHTIPFGVFTNPYVTNLFKFYHPAKVKHRKRLKLRHPIIRPFPCPDAHINARS